VSGENTNVSRTCPGTLLFFLAGAIEGPAKAGRTSMKIFGLMLAGAFGALARYGLTLAIQNWLAGRGSRGVVATHMGVAFPLGTLVINVMGALLLAFLVTLVAQEAVKPEWRLVLGTGFLGAFTTFSTFELESEELLSSGNWPAALAYIGGNLILGFGAIILGRALAFKLLGPGTP